MKKETPSPSQRPVPGIAESTDPTSSGGKKVRFFLMNVGYLTNYLRALNIGEIELLPIVNDNKYGPLEEEILVQLKAARLENLPENIERAMADADADRTGVSRKVVQDKITVLETSTPITLVRLPDEESKNWEDFIEKNLHNLHRYTGNKKEIEGNRSMISEMLRIQSLEEREKPFSPSVEKRQGEEVSITYRKEAVLETSPVLVYKVKRYDDLGKDFVLGKGINLAVFAAIVAGIFLAILAYNYRSLQRLIRNVFRRAPRQEDTSQANEL